GSPSSLIGIVHGDNTPSTSKAIPRIPVKSIFITIYFTQSYTIIHFQANKKSIPSVDYQHWGDI
ncbi:MAG: hypothetical protein IKT03_00265, partial [Muribaculaceae bacterium]|nr:hypothetical protein [Muribaculaceae bacterium]